jgi:DNA invertase Pin-like site-specific DNA recombinase
MKAVIYARTGSIDQSTITQIDLCRGFIREQGGEVVGVYYDEGISAHELERYGLDQLKSDALAHKFNAVVVTGFDRLYRSHSHVDAFQSELSQSNIELMIANQL